MKKFKIHASMVTYLSAIIEADSLEEAQDKAEELAQDGGMEEEGDGAFNWDTALDHEMGVKL